MLLLAPLAQASDTLTVESVDGDGAVLIFSGTDLQVHPAKKGEQLHYWDVVQTSRLAAAHLRYPDGSVVVVGRDTKFTFQPKLEGTQYNQLDWGQVRAQVEKSKNADAKAPPRFVIRTKTATMGVRGTDFVAGYDAGTAESSLHTIEGEVHIASDESKIMAWQGTPVSAGHGAAVGVASTQVAVSDFAPQAYKQQIQTAQPELVALADRPSTDSERKPAETEPGEASAPPSTTQASINELKSDEEPGLSLLAFRVGAESLLQFSKVQYTTAELSWNPAIRLFGPISLRGNLGGILLKDADTGKSFPLIRAGALLDVDLFAAIHLEAGAGRQTLQTDTQMGTFSFPYLMGNVAWHFAPGKWIDTIYVGASQMFNLPGGSQGVPIECSAGIGLRFW